MASQLLLERFWNPVEQMSVALSFAFALDNPLYSDRTLLVSSCKSYAPTNFCPSQKKVRKGFECLYSITCAVALTFNKLKLSVDGENGPAEEEVQEPAGPVVRVHVNRMLLVAASSFFKALFGVDMMERTQEEVHLQYDLHLSLFLHGLLCCLPDCLQIWLKMDEEEMEPFLDALQFLYTSTLKASTLPAMVKVLLIADKV